MDWKRLQSEHRVWVEAVFPDQPPQIPAAGMVEEAGELLHAVLADKRRILWGAESARNDPYEEAVDAVGDCTIYACSMYNALGWTFHVPMAAPVSSDVLSACISLVQIAALNALPPYRPTTVDLYLQLVQEIAHLLSINFEAAVEKTWNRVKRRRRGLTEPRIICFCGSGPFESEQHRLETEGAIVLMPIDGCSDAHHRAKIRAAHSIHVLHGFRPYCTQCEWECTVDSHTRVDTPYIGPSTAAEIQYAESLGKQVTYVNTRR